MHLREYIYKWVVIVPILQYTDRSIRIYVCFLKNFQLY